MLLSLTVFMLCSIIICTFCLSQVCLKPFIRIFDLVGICSYKLHFGVCYLAGFAAPLTSSQNSNRTLKNESPKMMYSLFYISQKTLSEKSILALCMCSAWAQRSPFKDGTEIDILMAFVFTFAFSFPRSHLFSSTEYAVLYFVVYDRVACSFHIYLYYFLSLCC